jgi:predicted secreted protein
MANLAMANLAMANLAMANLAMANLAMANLAMAKKTGVAGVRNWEYECVDAGNARNLIPGGEP